MAITRRDFMKGILGAAGAVVIAGCISESVRAERRYDAVLDDVYGFGESLVDNPALPDEDWEKLSAGKEKPWCFSDRSLVFVPMENFGSRTLAGRGRAIVFLGDEIKAGSFDENQYADNFNMFNGARIGFKLEPSKKIFFRNPNIVVYSIGEDGSWLRGHSDVSSPGFDFYSVDCYKDIRKADSNEIKRFSNLEKRLRELY